MTWFTRVLSLFGMVDLDGSVSRTGSSYHQRKLNVPIAGKPKCAKSPNAGPYRQSAAPSSPRPLVRCRGSQVSSRRYAIGSGAGFSSDPVSQPTVAKMDIFQTSQGLQTLHLQSGHHNPLSAFLERKNSMLTHFVGRGAEHTSCRMPTPPGHN